MDGQKINHTSEYSGPSRWVWQRNERGAFLFRNAPLRLEAAENVSLAVLASALRASFTASKLQSSRLAALRSTHFEQPQEMCRSRCWLRRSGLRLPQVNSSPRASPPCDQHILSCLRKCVVRGVLALLCDRQFRERLRLQLLRKVLDDQAHRDRHVVCALAAPVKRDRVARPAIENW